MNWMIRFKIMPLLILVATLSLGVRFSDFITSVSAPRQARAADEIVTLNEAQAEVEHGAVETQIGEIEVKEMPEPPPMEGDEQPTGTLEKPTLDEGEEINWRDAGDTDFEYSETRMELFKDLSERRKKLEVKERELSVREALLKTAEKELGQKYDELTSLKKEIEDLLITQSDEEKARTTSLVKIYEGMKPKEAARIFDTLDLDVLLQVMSGMSERKSAPILAAMDPQRARTVTIMLMEQKSLPSLTEDMM